jgi:hypothetical protein
MIVNRAIFFWITKKIIALLICSLLQTQKQQMVLAQSLPHMALGKFLNLSLFFFHHLGGNDNSHTTSRNWWVINVFKVLWDLGKENALQMNMNILHKTYLICCNRLIQTYESARKTLFPNLNFPSSNKNIIYFFSYFHVLKWCSLLLWSVWNNITICLLVSLNHSGILHK